MEIPRVPASRFVYTTIAADQEIITDIRTTIIHVQRLYVPHLRRTIREIKTLHAGCMRDDNERYGLGYVDGVKRLSSSPIGNRVESMIGYEFRSVHRNRADTVSVAVIIGGALGRKCRRFIVDEEIGTVPGRRHR